ncbi:hypothetical protein [Pseudooceanicola sp. MF1-13]|uniref:hypothetical protein n=1 Tax=Pseudooceanicola sp. MF1-13 TaxID=3379095 RepID=UPI00389254BB
MRGSRQIAQTRPVQPGEFAEAVDPAMCRILWCAVLHEQWRLAQGVGFQATSATKHAARVWFKSKDFGMVCHLAGLDPAQVLASYRAQVENRGAA